MIELTSSNFRLIVRKSLKNFRRFDIDKYFLRNDIRDNRISFYTAFQWRTTPLSKEKLKSFSKLVIYFNLKLRFLWYMKYSTARIKNKSEREHLCTHQISRQPRQREIAHLAWLRHHLAQFLYAELYVKSTTWHVDADPCILLIQLCFHLFQLVQYFWIGFPEVFATRGALWLRTHLWTVSNDRNNVLRIFQPSPVRQYTQYVS